MKTVIKGTLVGGCVVFIVISVGVLAMSLLGIEKSDRNVVSKRVDKSLGHDCSRSDSEAKGGQANPDTDQPRYRGVEAKAIVARELSVAVLANKLHEESDLDRVEYLAQQLAAIGSSNAVAALLDEIRHTVDSDKRGLIARAFQRLDNFDSAGAVVEGLVGISDDYVTLSALHECAPRVLNTNGLAFLLSTLEQSGSNSWQQSNLMGYLSEVRNPDCVGLLADTVWSVTNSLVRDQAIVSLAEIGDHASFSNLLEFISDESLSNSHEHILYMIGRMQNKELISSIANVFLSSTNASLKYAAARALTVIQSRGESDHQFNSETNLFPGRGVGEIEIMPVTPILN